MTAPPEGQILPTLFREHDPQYRMRPENFAVSFAMQAAVICALVLLAIRAAPPTKVPVSRIFNEISLPFIAQKPSGAGSGGAREKTLASKGALPPVTAKEPFTPPEAVLQNSDPALPMPPSILAISTVKLPQLGVLGDPHATATIPSNGIGGPSGIGNSCCNSVGDHAGNAFGDARGSIYVPGHNGVTQPKVLFDPDPEYSEEARQAKFQGSVILGLVVGPDGKPHGVKVQRSAGMGLDEKAMAAVNQWRFQPATLDGHPVAVRISVEVSFRLF